MEAGASVRACTRGIAVQYVFRFIVDAAMVNSIIQLQTRSEKGGKGRCDRHRAGKADGKGADEASHTMQRMRYACAGIESRSSSWMLVHTFPCHLAWKLTMERGCR